MRRSREVVLVGTTPSGESITLRPVRRGDRDEFLGLRARNAAWLTPWEPTVPPGGPPRRDMAADWRGNVRALQREARSGSGLSLVIVVDERIVGMVSASSIVEGALRSASIGYWVAQEAAGRGYAPTATALLVDHLMDPNGRALHRVQLEIRPENAASLAVVAKLGLREEGPSGPSSTSTGRGATAAPSRSCAKRSAPEGCSRVCHTHNTRHVRDTPSSLRHGCAPTA
ncbi:GNAT family N-acetyltransferase [Janibacter terrae]|uniref:GNAT family N-acetyltransferase n=1 Tax=Janibacter terrae TaxID=103817 RepID=UPI000A8E18A0|nr:GNAT family protein [Janibacter terrae]